MRKIYIICEGASEKAYIQKTNQHLREGELDILLIPKDAGGGSIKKITSCLSQFFKDEKKIRGEIWVWIDKDIYERDDLAAKQLQSTFEKKKSIKPILLFNTQNFEDFLSLHFDENLATEWMNICEQREHFTSPMRSKEHEPLFIEFLSNNTSLPRYKKGKNAIFAAMDWGEAFSNLKNNSGNPKLKQHSDLTNSILTLLK